MTTLQRWRSGWNRILIGTALLASLAPALSAQRSGHGYFQAGLHWLDLDNLNRRLALYGIEPFDELYLTLGGGGHVELGRIMLGGEGHGLIPQENTSAGYERELAGGMGFFDVGYIVVREGGARAYGLVGLGGGGFELETTQRSLPTFDDVMVDPLRGSDLSIGGFLVQAALGGEYIARFGRGDDHGISLGLRAGYTWAPIESDWHFNGSEAPGGPWIGLTGPYLRVSVGGGGR